MALKITNPISLIEIVPNNVHDVHRINSIQDRYKGARQESKSPTFALTR